MLRTILHLICVSERLMFLDRRIGLSYVMVLLVAISACFGAIWVWDTMNLSIQRSKLSRLSGFIVRLIESICYAAPAAAAA